MPNYWRAKLECQGCIYGNETYTQPICNETEELKEIKRLTHLGHGDPVVRRRDEVLSQHVKN